MIKVKSYPLTHGTEILIQPDYYFIYLDADTKLDLLQNKYYLTQRVLGCGSFASVYLAVDVFSNRKVACKIIDIKGHRLTNTTRAQIQSEISVLSRLNHRNIVQLLDSCVVGTKFYVFMTLVHGGELFDKIVQENGIAEAESNNIVLIGMLPFGSDDSPDSLMRNIKSGVIDFSDKRWNSISPDAKSLIKHLLVTDPDKRYTVDQIFQHRWIAHSLPVLQRLYSKIIERK
ncbi:Checkpoint kinase 2 [Boothiomyces sp. JEL0866]|nr:Checkpoint kinase 2 [Boothiomyces sp. JEL0866]KAJ3325645.1 Checkpoint kinase 2 [Boothiomyces sp. JEL0866]